MPFKNTFSFVIPEGQLAPEMYRMLGLSEEEIEAIKNRAKNHVIVDTNKHSMEDLEFDEYEEVKV